MCLRIAKVTSCLCDMICSSFAAFSERKIRNWRDWGAEPQQVLGGLKSVLPICPTRRILPFPEIVKFAPTFVGGDFGSEKIKRLI